MTAFAIRDSPDAGNTTHERYHDQDVARAVSGEYVPENSENSKIHRWRFRPQGSEYLVDAIHPRSTMRMTFLSTVF